MRLTKIYTRKGDEGYTWLENQRISKDDLLIEALGTLDELNATLGWLLAVAQQQNNLFTINELEPCLTPIQHALFDMGRELLIPLPLAITAEKVIGLEQQLDNWNATLPPLEEFILPRGNLAAAACHAARTVCRRTERCLVCYHRQIPLSNLEILRYINRLSDLLFVLARILARQTVTEEMMWASKKTHEQQER
jgi:cob(I)alamin adenosyltransferase